MVKKGDEVLTVGGMFGTVRKVGDDFVILEVADRTKVRLLRHSRDHKPGRSVEEDDEADYVEDDYDEADGDDEAGDEDADDEDEDAEDEDEDADDEDAAGEEEDDAC